MAMIDPKYKGWPVQHSHKRLSGATTGATMVSALGTGISCCPVYIRCSASVAVSMFLSLGSSAGSFWRSNFIVGKGEISMPWWDNTLTPNTSINLEVPTDPGVGEFDLWWIAWRSGAGSSGTGQ